MKKYLLAALALFVFLPAQADDRSKALLDALTAQMKGYSSYEIKFSSTMPGEFRDLEGRLVVSGSRYYVGTDDTEVFSDGKQRWTYNHDWKEAVLESAGVGEVGFLDNPAYFFASLTTDFTHVYKGAATIGGETVDVVELTPRSGPEGLTVTLRLDRTQRPVSLSYQSGQGQTLDVAIHKITPNVPVSDAMFTFDRRKHPEVEVVDFR